MRALLAILTAIYIVLLFIRPQEFIPALAGASLQQMVMLAAMLVWLTKPSRVISMPQIQLLVPFLLVASLSVGFSGWWGGTIVAANNLATSVILAVLLAAVAREERLLRKMMAVVALCAAALVYHGYQQMTTGVGWSGAVALEDRIYYVGILSDPNDLGLLFVVSLAFCLGLWWTLRGFVPRLFALAGIAWLSYGIYLTQSRGGMLAEMGVLTYFLWRKKGKAAVIAVAALALPVAFAATRLSQLSSEEESAAGRVDAWYEGIQEFFAHPLFGVGYGNYADISGSGFTAHNSIVLVFTETGLPGYFLWMGMAYCTAIMIIRLVQPRESSPTPVPATGTSGLTFPTGTDHGLAAAGIGFVIGAFFLSQSYKALFFILVGLSAGRYLTASEAQAADYPPVRFSAVALRVLLIAVTSILVLWLLVSILL